MDEFLIPSATRTGCLAFYDRTPFNRDHPINSFWVRVTDAHLSAELEVAADYVPTHPGALFADMQQQWSGWSDDLIWQSVSGELKLLCRHDGLGHISIQVKLRAGYMDDDWRVTATVIADAGQLESIARRAAVFFGREI